MKPRCLWCNLKNPQYVEYHDQEWGRFCSADAYLFEMLVLESFQAGLSWECVLNKREDFRKCYDGFDVDKVSCYGEEKVRELMGNEKIIRNRLKIMASIENAKIFKKIQREFGSFYAYLVTFTGDKVLYEVGKVTNAWSDEISLDLRKRGMKFVGSTIIYSYLQAVGMIYSHERGCFLYREER